MVAPRLVRYIGKIDLMLFSSSDELLPLLAHLLEVEAGARQRKRKAAMEVKIGKNGEMKLVKVGHRVGFDTLDKQTSLEVNVTRGKRRETGRRRGTRGAILGLDW